MHYKDFSWNGASFLLADDDNYSHLLLEKVFSKTGAHLIHAYNGKQAIDLALTHDIELAIIDIVMPDYNGYEVASAIKLEKPGVVCIAYTADAMRINLNQSSHSGFDKVLVKPLLPAHLFKEIEVLLIENKIYK